mgnify:CR=1 FL=1
MDDREFCNRKNIISKSDAVRSALFSLCKDYEQEKYNQLILKLDKQITEITDHNGHLVFIDECIFKSRDL